MTTLLRRFRQHEDGAITVDWVVLTAACVALGLAAGFMIFTTISAPDTGLLPEVNSALSQVAQ